MLTPIGNIHNHKLPEPGMIGYLIGGYEHNKPKFWKGKKQCCIVESFPLCDTLPYQGTYYSLGIHTITVRFLGDNERVRVSGLYFQEEI